MNKLYVIGIGYKPLDERASEMLRASSAVFASGRLLDVFRRYPEFGECSGKIRLVNSVDETMNLIRIRLEDENAKQDTVLLASGDPLFFGIGRRAVLEFGPEKVGIMPDMSSVQNAFARIKEPWDDAFLMSLHGGPDPAKRRRLPYELKDVPALLVQHPKIAILTDRENSPSVIAGVVGSSKIPGIKVHVCEKVGYPDERIISGTPEEISALDFGSPNVVILINQKKSPSSDCKSPLGRGAGVGLHDIVFGLCEDEISHSRGLITKDEVRAVSLHKLRLPRRGVLWDIGAGSGSVSIEAARLCPGLKVFAVEKEEEQASHIEANLLRFGVPNVELVRGAAPEALSGLPKPDRVFMGGSGGRLAEIIPVLSGIIETGIVIINAVTLETLNESIPLLESSGFRTSISEISVSRSREVAGKKIMNAVNPVFVIKGEKF